MLFSIHVPFYPNLFVELDLLLYRQQSEDADIKRKTDILSQFLKRVEVREIRVASLSPKGEVKNHRGNHQN